MTEGGSMEPLSFEQIRTLRSLKDIYGDGSFYSLEYRADHRLDEVLGAGAETWEELRARLKLLLTKGGDPDLSSGDGCTVFTVKDSRGHVLVGRNFDFRHKKSGGAHGCLLVRTAPKKGFRSLGMVDFGFAGLESRPGAEGFDPAPLLLSPYSVMDGMNEQGVAIAILALAHPGARQDTGKPKIFPTLAMRAVLDRASSLKDVIDIFSSRDMQMPTPRKSFQFFAADREGRSAVIEYDETRMYVVDSPLVTNFYLAEGISDKAEGKKRYETAKALIDYRGGLMEKDQVMAVLRLLSQPAAGKENSDTLWSAVFDLTEGTAEIAAGHRYGSPLRFGLSDQKGGYE